MLMITYWCKIVIKIYLIQLYRPGHSGGNVYYETADNNI